MPAALVLLVWIHAIAHAATATFDEARLRSLLRLPRVDLQMSLMFDSTGEYEMNGQSLDSFAMAPPRERIAEIRKSLRGDGTDAERWETLAGLYGSVHDEANAGAATDRAAELYRARVQADPENGWLKCRLAKLLSNLTEAERLARSATSTAPNDWRCWVALGNVLVAEAMKAAGVTNSIKAEPDALARARAASVATAGPGRVRARQLFEEARTCFDKAVSLAGDDPRPYAARAGFLWTSNAVARPLLESDPAADAPTNRRRLPPQVVADLKSAAKLATTNAFAVGAAVVFEVLDGAADAPADELEERGFRSVLPEAAWTFVRDSVDRLEAMSRQPAPEVASAALSVKGGVECSILRDLSAAEDSLRRSLKRNPLPQVTWDLLFGVVATAGRWQELAQLATECLEKHDSAWAHFIAAKAYEKLGRATQVEQQLAAALNQEPQNVLVNLAVAAQSLKTAKDDASLQAVAQRLARLQPEVEKQGPPAQFMEFEFFHGILFALMGNRDEAARHFRRLRTADPENKEYQEAYEALGR